MFKWSFSSCLAILVFSLNLCHAQAGAPVSPPDEAVETEDDCDGWEAIASSHWNTRVYRLQWKYPDAPYFGDLPQEVKVYLIAKYCENGVDWVSENPDVVKDMMEWKWPVETVK